MVHICKMIISSGVFFIFFKILIFWVHSRVKVQKTVQNEKRLCLLLSISQEPYIILLSFTVEMCKVVCPGVFFNFKIMFFRGLKDKKWPKMTKSSICGTLYFRNHISNDLHLSYTYMYERLILIFRIISGVKGQKMARNDKKFSLYHSIPQEPYIIWLWFGYTCVKWWYIQQIFSYFKILKIVVFRGVKGQKMTLNYQFQYVLLYISGIVDHIEILIMISTGVFLSFFFFKCNIVNIKIILFFIGSLQQFF